MKRLVAKMMAFMVILSIGAVVRGATPPTGAQTYYGLFVGINEFSDADYLYGCDWDAMRMMDAYTRGGFCAEANAELVANLSATKETVREKFNALAAKAKAGDTVLYYQSSHGGDYNDDKGSFLCLTDDEWYDTEFADDLARFADGVCVIVVLDACNSGGMFKSANGGGASGKKAKWNFAASVQRQLSARRSGAKGTPSVAWITAADWYESSWMDGRGSEFSHALLNGWEDGSADADSDGYVSFGELSEYAKSEVSGSYVQSENDVLLGNTLAGQDFDVDMFRILSFDGVVYGALGEHPSSLELPSDTTAIADGAFDGFFEMDSVVLPAGLERIGFDAFASCGLTSVLFPSSVTFIDEYAFEESELETVAFNGDPSDIYIADTAFWGTPYYATLFPPPANDNFSDAEEISGESGSVWGDNRGATSEAGEPLTDTYESSATVWYRWTASATGTVTFDTDGSSFDTVLGVYTGGAVDALGIVVENDDGAYGDASAVTFDAVAGTTYYISVGGYEIETGEVALNWQPGEYLPVDLEWYTSRDEAVAAALDDGRRILLVSGRDGCSNTAYLRETACYDPDVMEILQEDFILWYNDCDEQGEEVLAYIDGMDSYALPLVCALDPYDMDTYIDRSTGFMDEEALYDFLMSLPEWEPSGFALDVEEGWITGYFGEIPDGEMIDLEIPEGVEGIDDGALEGLAGLRSLYVPASVTYIGEYAFASCPDLEGVYFLADDSATESYLEVGTCAFAWCGSLTEVSFEDRPYNPEGKVWNEIGICESAFDGCEALTYLYLGEGVVEIGDSAFYGIGIESLEIPASCALVGEYAFEECTALEVVRFLAVDSMQERCLDVCIGAFAGCESLASVEFEDCPYDRENEDRNCIYIYESAFDGCEALTDLYLGEGVEEIGESAFLGIGIGRLEIPASCYVIGESAFADCENLEEVYFAGYDDYDDYELDMDEDSVFDGTPYGNRFRLDIEDNVVVGYKGEIPDGEMVDLEIPDDVEGVADGAFEGLAGLYSLYVPASVTYIGENAFADCSDLEGVYFLADDSVTESYLGVGAYAFAGCESLAEVSFDDRPYDPQDEVQNEIAICESAFNGCEALTDLYLGEGVVEIGDSAFYGISIEELTVPASCCYIGEAAFAYSENLEEVDFVGYDVYGEGYEIEVDVLSAFEGTPWIERNNFVLEIEDGVVLGYSGEVPEELVIPEGVARIAEYAFSCAYGLQTLVLPSTLRSIDEYAFECCYDLETVSGLTDAVDIAPFAFVQTPFNQTRPFGLDIVDNCVIGFHGTCPSVLSIPEGVTNIAESAFDFDVYVAYDYGLCGSDDTDEILFSPLLDLTAVTIPASVRTIGAWAFYGLDAITSVTIANPDIAFDGSAFYGCEKLKSFGLSKTGYLLEGWELEYRADFGVWISPSVCAVSEWRLLAASGTVEQVEPDIGLFIEGGKYDYQATDCDSDESVWTSVSFSLHGVWATPVWKADQFTLTFDSAGGSAVAPITQGYGTAVTSPAAPTRTGYTFAGWTPAVPATMPAANQKLTAQWTVNSYTVTFDANGGAGTMADQTFSYGEMKALNECAFTRMAYDFRGWATTPTSSSIEWLDNELVENLTATADGRVTLYAVWEPVSLWVDPGMLDVVPDVGIRIPVLSEDEMFDAAAAASFDGYLMRDDEVKGAIQVKVGKANVRTGTTKVSATVILLGQSKKLSYKGTLETLAKGADFEPGRVTLTSAGAPSMTLLLGRNAFWGKLGEEFEINGSRNVFAKASDPNAAVLAGKQGVYTIALETVDAEGAGASFAWGYSGLTLTVGNKGKVKVQGTLVDGTKVSVSSQLLVGEERCCIPVVAQLYSKKGGFALNVWLQNDGTIEVGGLSAWDATASKAPFMAWFGENVLASRANMAIPASRSFLLEGEPNISGMEILYDFLPWQISFTTGGRWTIPPAGLVKYDREADDYVDAKDSENAAGLKLAYVSKTGAFKGSFKVYALDAAGHLKKYTANVTGVMVGADGYGTATIKNIGSMPVMIK